MARPWEEVRDEVRGLVLGDTLVRAVAAGRRRGVPLTWRRAELRPVDLRAGRRLQVVTYDERQAHTANHDPAAAGPVLDELLAQGFGNWHVETVDEIVQVRITKKGDAQVHREARTAPAADRGHDRVKPRLLDPEHPDVAAFLTAVGVADREGRVKPSRQDKYRQVEQFVRLLDAALEDAVTAGALRMPTAQSPWRVVDLGCGNAYLTLGAYVWLARVRGLPVRVHGVDVRKSFLDRNAELAASLGWSDGLTFEAATIADAADAPDVAGSSGAAGYDVVVALHACDTATDDALARAVRWSAPVVLAAPCCHHDLQTQVSASSAPAPYAVLARHGLLRERFVDVLTDGIRAAVLRLVGYRVETVEFVSDTHTPRNLMIRAVRTGAAPARSDIEDYDRLVAEWGLRPALAERLADELAGARGDR